VATQPLPLAAYPLVAKRGTADCGIACLAMFLRRDYEDVLIAAARINPNVWHTGVYFKDFVRTAKQLGVKAWWRHMSDLDSATGVLWVTYRDNPREHVVLVIEGSVIDPDAPLCLWDDVDDFVGHYNAVVHQLLVREEL
jgi:hypothetical protein